MDLVFSALIGAIIFTAFAAGLAESIGTAPFFIIVGFVIFLMGLDTYQTVKEQLKSGKPDKK